MLDEIDPLRRFHEVVRNDRWASLFPALEELCQTMMGHKLFSCSVFRLTGPQSGVAARVYSSDETNYPVSGLKQIVPNRWTDQVIANRNIFVANRVDQFSDVFPDHELIASLGLGSVVNFPVVVHGDFIGTVNLLDAAGHYTDIRLDDIERLTLPALLAFEVSPEADIH